ncbi:MAG: HAMP domain-containing histidine kinase, partial [Oscillospiraceae bacterium]|nr:HAMP domain-containing histidine kinase [Oscillospiraceae bacterium]
MRKLSLKGFIFIAVAVCVLFTAVNFAVDFRCGILSAVLSAVLLILFAVFEISRTKFIANINDYLSLVLQGNYSFDISDNFEGELSILKNNIYKVVVMLKSTNEELKKEKLNLAQSLADITHQLKTPLTSITVMTDLMENEDMREKRSELLGIIKAQTDKMNWLTVTLLKLSRLDADAIAFNFSDICISDIVDTSLKTFQPTLDIKNITVNKNFTDFVFNGDVAWTAEAVKNIIKNCIEHTDADG